MTNTKYYTLLIAIITLSTVPWIVLFFFGKKIRVALRRRQNIRKETFVSIQEITAALIRLQKLKKGATIIIKQNDDLRESIADQIEIDAILSSQLIINIFEGDKSPLHDGAMIVQGSKILSASAYITNISNQKVPKEFGTRHRSALGLSEVADAIVIVLSEESQRVSIFRNGKHFKVKEIADVRTEITNQLIERENN